MILTFGERLFLEEVLLSGFMAVAWMRATQIRAGEERVRLGRLLRLPGRIERLQRARWQWGALTALLMVLKLQRQLLPAAEVVVALEFLMFMAWPASGPRRRTGRAHAAVAPR